MIRPAELQRDIRAELRVEVVRDLRRFTELRDQWEALLAQSAAGPFNAWAWLHPWRVHLGTQRSLFLLAAWDGEGRLAGLLPLVSEPRRVAGLRVRRLAFLGERHAGGNGLDVIARRGEERHMAQRFAEYLSDRAENWDELELCDVDSSSLTLNAFRRVFAADPFRLRIDLHTVMPAAQAGSNTARCSLTLRVRRRNGVGAWLARTEQWAKAWRGWTERVRGSHGRGGG